MTRATVFLAVFAMSAFPALAETEDLRETEEGQDQGGVVVICPINGMIDDGMAVVVQRAVGTAVDAKAIIFVVDTPGGKVDSCLEIVESILDARCQTIAYIEGMGAISAGAILSYACQDMIMSPTTNMGAAAPVMFTPEGVQPLGEKEVSFVRAKIAALAEQNGHNPAIAQAMVDKDIVLRAYVNEKGEVIVYRADEERDARPRKTRINEIIETLTEALPISEEMAKKVKGALGADEEEPAEEDREVEMLPDGGELVLASGKLLTLTPKEAIRYGVIPTTCNSIEEVMSYYRYHGLQQVHIEMTWAEKVFRFLTTPTVSSLLLMGGIAGLYMEAKTPGFGVFGIVGIICLALFFGARAVLGLTEWIDILLIAAGLGLLAVEMFVLPGFGIVGIGGIACLAAGLFLSFTYNDFTWPEYSWHFDRIRDAGYSLTLAIVTFVAFVLVMWKTLPHTPVYGMLVLQHAQAKDEGYVVQTEAQRDAAIGLKGVTISMLRPAGKACFDDKAYRVVSRAEFIEKGTPIVIVQVAGNRYVVDKFEEEA